MEHNKSFSIVTSNISSKEKEQIDSIKYWQNQGPSKIWNAMFELLNFWYVSRGLDPALQRVDKTIGGIEIVPWMK